MFVDPDTRDTVHVQEYVSRLFPQFRGNQLHMVAKNYEHLVTPFSKVIQIMGEGKVVTMKEVFGYTDRSLVHSHLRVSDILCSPRVRWDWVQGMSSFK